MSELLTIECDSYYCHEKWVQAADATDDEIADGPSGVGWMQAGPYFFCDSCRDEVDTAIEQMTGW